MKSKSKIKSKVTKPVKVQKSTPPQLSIMLLCVGVITALFAVFAYMLTH